MTMPGLFANPSFRRSITEKEAYIEILDTNKELRKELGEEITENKLKDKKLKALSRELETCYRAISHQDSTIIAHEDEIESLKTEIKSLKQRLYKALQDLRHKGDASTAQDIHILRLEDMVEQLKKRIREITDKKVFQINSSPMALPDILRNIGTALDRVERYIDGDTSFNPKNTLNGIRISVTTIREHMERHVQDNANLQDLLNASHRQTNRTMNDITNFRNDCLRNVQMMEQAWRDERQARQQRDDEIINLRDTVCENVYEKCWWKRRYTACTQQAQNLKRYYRQSRNDIGLLEYNRDRLFNRYQKWKAREINSRQIILNLQNNPLINPPNMAEARRQPLYNTIATIFAKHEQYTGQESPDDYLDKIWNSISHLEPNMTALENVNAGDFDDAIKLGLLKSKLGGKYIPVPANDPYNGANPINSPASLRTWMRSKYQRETIGSQQVAFQRLTQERFLPSDSPDTYEKRIRPLLLGIADNDARVLGFLKSHLSGDLFTWMRIANPAGIDAFFIQLKDLWLERNPSVSTGQIPILHQPELQSILPTPIPLKDDFKIRLARDLQYARIATDDATLEKFIYDDLKKKLGKTTAHVRKSPFESRSVNATKKVVRKVVQKPPVKRIIRLCSVCRKAGHIKTNCPGVKTTKKVNYVYQNAEKDLITREPPDDSEEPEIEYVLEEEVRDGSEPEIEYVLEEEVEEDVEYVDDDDSNLN